VRDDDRRADLVEQLGSGFTPRHVREVRRPGRLLVGGNRGTGRRAATTAGRTARPSGTGAATAGGRAGRLRIHDVAAALRGEELRHVCGPGHTLARPHRVVPAVGIRIVGPADREDELALQALHRAGALRNRAVEILVLWRPSVAWAVHDVHLVAFGGQVLEPARAPVGRAHPVEALPAAAVYQHDRERVPHTRRHHVLDVHLLPADEAAARRIGPLHVDPHVAPLGQIEWKLLGRRRGGKGELGCLRGTGRQWTQGRRRRAGRAEHGGLSHELAPAEGASREALVEILQRLVHKALLF
jgi:hypothetical protein